MFFNNNNNYKILYANIFKFCSVENNIIRLFLLFRYNDDSTVMDKLFKFWSCLQFLDTDLIIFIGTTKQVITSAVKSFILNKKVKYLIKTIRIFI